MRNASILDITPMDIYIATNNVIIIQNGKEIKNDIRYRSNSKHSNYRIYVALLVQYGEKEGAYMIIFLQIFAIFMGIMALGVIFNNYLNGRKGNIFILTDDGWERFDKQKCKWVKANESEIKKGDRII